MRRVWFAFLLSFLAIWSGNSMEGNKGSVKDNVPMTFVLGTDKNYIVPTLVTIHSLLKNGIKGVKSNINIVVLSEGLEYEEREVFDSIFKKMAGALLKEKTVMLYFIDIPASNTLNPWNAITGKNVDDIFKFSGANVKGKRMPKYKAMLPFYINKCHKAEIPHYMWLDSDILINEDISNLYQECLGKKAAIGSANYWFVSEDISHSNKIDKGIIIRKIDILPLKKNPNAPFFLSQCHAEKTGWRCSGGVMFFNTFHFSPTILPKLLGSGKQLQIQDEEQFFYWYFTQKNPFGALDEKKEGKKDEKKDEKKEGELIYAFSPIYNCRPSMPSAAQETSDELKTKQMKVPAELKKITNPEEIAIWHWDGMRKPWQKMYGGFPLIAGKAMSSKYDGLMDADRQWIKEYEEVRLIIKQLKHRFSACLYNFEQMAGKNS